MYKYEFFIYRYIFSFFSFVYFFDDSYIVILSKLQTENIKVCTINAQCFSRKTAVLVCVRIIEPEV